jgi:hypothetical protein
MGDLAFGKDFDMVNSAKSHSALKLLMEGMKPLGLLTPVPWALLVLKSLPIGGEYRKFIKWGADQVQERKKVHNTSMLS